MTDFIPIIYRNLALFPGIVESPEVIEKIDSLLQRVEQAGHQKLIDNFCSQNMPDRARDFLFELSLCGWLLENTEIVELEYEPSGEERPPDFRFKIRDVTFDIQAKRLHQVGNEIIKELFEREVRNRLSRICRPWLISYWVSGDLERCHINHFFEYIRDNIDSFHPALTITEGIRAKQYHWPEEGQLLVRFSFLENPDGDQSIKKLCSFPIGDEHGMCQWIPKDPIRKKMKSILRTSSGSFSNPVSATQSNIVVMQAMFEIMIDEHMMSDLLWGDELIQIPVGENDIGEPFSTHAENGLFRNESFSHICGLVLISDRSTPIDASFSGAYFPNPMHLEMICKHPKPFPEMSFTVLKSWG